MPPPNSAGRQARAVRGDRHADQIDERRQQRDSEHGDVLGQQQSQPRHRRGDERFQRAALALAGREIDRRINGPGHGHQHEDQRNERRQRKRRRAAKLIGCRSVGRRHVAATFQIASAAASEADSLEACSRDSTKCSAASLVGEPAR